MLLLERFKAGFRRHRHNAYWVESVPLNFDSDTSRCTLLLLLNGPPAAGKTSLAQRWIADRRLALNLDLDQLWPLLGQWQADLDATGRTARRLALAMARTQLAIGQDVIVPQYLGRPEFIDELADLGGPAFRHVVLLPPFAVVAARFHDRAEHPVAAAGRARFDDPDGLRQLYDRVLELAAARPEARVIELVGDEPLAVVHQRLELTLAGYPTESGQSG